MAFFKGVQDKIANVDVSINIPVSKAELSVLRSVFKVCLPLISKCNVFIAMM